MKKIFLYLISETLIVTEVNACVGFADGAVETVITFDQGAKWQRLRRPQNSKCDTETSTNRPNRVRRIDLNADYLNMCFACHVHVICLGCFVCFMTDSMSVCSENVT